MSTAQTKEEEKVVWKGAPQLREHLRPIHSLRPFPGNPPRKDVDDLVDSLKRFGQVRPVLLYEQDNITMVAGHHVWKAAKELGWTHIAATSAKFASKLEAKAYLVADNETAQKMDLRGVDDYGTLTLMEELAASKHGLEGTGWTVDDLEDARMLGQFKAERVRLDSLKEGEQNYKKHGEAQLAHLTASLKEHGFYRNIVVANDGTVLAGHGILAAAREMGLKKIPVTKLPYGPDDPRAIKVMTGDNELGALAEVDHRTLTDLLKKVRDEGDVQMLLGTGFDAQTLAALVMVTRPESEIANHDAAAEWINLPGFETVGERVQLILSFDSAEERDVLVGKVSPKEVDERAPTACAAIVKVLANDALSPAERLTAIRDVAVEAVGLGVNIIQATRWVESAWWPPREQNDLSSLTFKADEGDGQNSNGGDGE